MLVSIKPFYGKIFLSNKLFKVGNGHNIFYKFDKRIGHNIKLVTSDKDYGKKVERYVYVDVPYPWQIKQWLRLIFSDKSRNILFCFESPLVNPFNHIRILHKFFSKVITWNDDLVTMYGYTKMNIPQLKATPKNKIKFQTKNLLVAVYTNKSVPEILKIFSKYKADLYETRHNLFKSLDLYNNFHLYGRGWNKSRPYNIKDKLNGPNIFKSYKGTVKNKLDTISKYKFCFAFENASAPGYITEKIFDCFQAGCVPIYYGAPNILDYIPKEAFIDYRKFGSIEKLIKFLENMSEKEYENYVNHAQKFLKSDIVKTKWFEKGFTEIFLSALE